MLVVCRKEENTQNNDLAVGSGFGAKQFVQIAILNNERCENKVTCAVAMVCDISL